MRSGLNPAMEAQVRFATPAQHPAEMMPHSAPVISASRLPTPSASSSICTKLREASSIAFFTSGNVCEPVMMVKVPRALITGRTPMDR